MNLQPLDPNKDKPAAHRIWHEIGWGAIDNPGAKLAVDLQLDACDGLVVRVDGEAECIVLTAPGSLAYLDQTIPLSGVMAVATSHIMRKRGIAGRMTAQAIANSVAQGAMLSGLGMFEQGFYNRLGFGTISYEHLVSFDPRRLTVDVPTRQPVRITNADWQAVHASRVKRMPLHGAVSFESPNITRARMEITPNGFGLGYRDAEGELIHHIWFLPTDMEFGPYRVEWMVHRNYKEMLELLGLIRSLGDQVRLIQMFEPAGIQFQDILRDPIHSWVLTKQSRYTYNTETLADAQLRICDLRGCLERTQLHCDEFRFTLELIDPIETFLPTDAPWRGESGEYIVTLGKHCHAETGADKSIPTLKTTINAFTRMWLGVRPATALAVTETLQAPPELLEALDWAFRLPTPKRDWDY